MPTYNEHNQRQLLRVIVDCLIEDNLLGIIELTNYASGSEIDIEATDRLRAALREADHMLAAESLVAIEE